MALNLDLQNWQQRANKIENLPNNYSTCHLLTEITEISAFDCSVQLSVLLESSAQLEPLQSNKLPIRKNFLHKLMLTDQLNKLNSKSGSVIGLADSNLWRKF